MTAIYEHQYDNGLTLVAEQIAGAQSLAMSFLLPAGSSVEPEGQQGVATMLEEMICRGAGDRDARAHSDALDFLGVHRGTSVEANHLRLGATMIHSKLPQALPLLVDMIRRPQLPDTALEPTRDLSLQSLDALDDNPQQKVFFHLRRQHFPWPFGRSPLGQREHLEHLTLDQVRDYWRQVFVPGGAILSFAGKFDWEDLKARVGDLLGDWQGRREEVPLGQPAQRGYFHEAAETNQVHLGLAYDAPPEPDPQSILQRASAAVLSGGMSGRLFTEVRERRGLCYSVFAAYAGGKRLGAVLSYAGTTVPRAQETYDVLANELRRISEGIEQGEFERAIVGMKSRLVMQGESTGARAHAIAADTFVYGRPRTLDEMAAQVDGVTLEELNAYVRSNPPGAMTVVTVGPEPLTIEEMDR